MHEHITALKILNGVINPYLIGRHEFINVIVPPHGKVDIKDTAHQAAIYDPHSKTILKFLPRSFLDIVALRKSLVMVSDPTHIADTPALLSLHPLGFNQGFII